MATDLDRYNFHLEVIDYFEVSGSLHVIVEERKSGRRYEMDGRIGVDRVVEPFGRGYPYHPSNAALADEAANLAAEYVEKHTPFEMYEGEHWHYTQTLRGLSFNERAEFDKLSIEELRELVIQLKNGKIEL